LTATGAVLPASFEVANRLAEFASHEAQDLHPRQESTPRWPRPPRQCKHFGCVRAMSLKIMARISFSPLTAHTSSFVLFPSVFFFFCKINIDYSNKQALAYLFVYCSRVGEFEAHNSNRAADDFCLAVRFMRSLIYINSYLMSI